MSYLAGFQPLEQRDSDDLVVAEGVVSNRSPFATEDNQGIYDVVAENFRYLNEELQRVSSSNDLSSIRDEIKEMYTSMTTDSNFGQVQAKAQAEIATEQAQIATSKAQEATDSLNSVIAKEGSINDNLLTLQTQAEEVQRYLATIGTLRDEVSSEATVAINKAQDATDSATDASASATNAQAWAVGSDSPDGAEDADSITGKTMSAKSWAVFSEDKAKKAKTSEDNAKESETNAKTSEEKAKESELACQTSETNAKTSEEVCFNWAEGYPEDTINDEGDSVSHYSSKYYSEQSSLSADSARGYAEDAKEQADISQTSANSASECESKAKAWAESSDVVETTTETKIESVPNEDGSSVEKQIDVKTDHYSAKYWAEMAKRTFSDGEELKAKVREYTESAKSYMENTAVSEANGKSSEDNAKGSEDKATEQAGIATAKANEAQISETNAKEYMEQAQRWSMSDVSPDDGFDENGANGKTQSSKSWAKTAKEQALEATKQKNEVSQYTETVKGVLKQALDLKSNIDAIESSIKTLTEQANTVLAESVKIRESISSAVTYKGSVENYSDLPTEGNKVGDMYNIKNPDKENGCKPGDNVVWNGAEWDNMGGLIDPDDILLGGRNATFGEVTASTFTGKLIGNADTATTADTANSVAWENVTNAPTSMPANGGTADRALKADVCTGNAATATNASKVGGFSVGCNVPANAKFTDTTYATMKGATTTAAGGGGLVPAPAKGAVTRHLRSDGSWADLGGLVKAASVKGKVITFTRYNGTTFTITVG